MCGIAGWIRNGKKKVSEDELKGLLIMLSTRGVDATGIAWEDSESIHIMKTDIESDKFVELDEFKENIRSILDAEWVLLHCRQATSGSPSNNKNNHPIFNDKGMIIHNGIVRVKGKELKSCGKTDSEQILLHIQQYGYKEGLKKIRGSMSFAWVNFDEPGFYLYTDGTPLVIAKDPNRKITFFCSTWEILSAGVSFKMADNLMFKAYHEDVPINRLIKVTKGGTRIVGKVVTDTSMYVTNTVPWYAKRDSAEPRWNRLNDEIWEGV